MGPIGIVAVVLVAIVAGVVFLAVATSLILRLIKRPLEARIAEVYRPDEILMQDLAANTFGVESRGVWQGRGNGALVLTGDCLHFFRFVPGGDVRVPLGSIREVTFTKTHLGKATIYDLLKVRFATEGASDSVAWYVTDPKAWKNRIDQLLP